MEVTTILVTTNNDKNTQRWIAGLIHQSKC